MWHKLVEDQGFAIVPGVLTERDVDHVIEELAQAPLPRSRAGSRHALKHPSIAKLARDPRLVELAGDILGSAATPFRATIFDKSSGANWLVVWHQDTALPLETRQDVPGWGPWSVKDGVIYAHAPAAALSKVIALRVHLDDSTLENGPLRVLAGTHAMGVLSDEALLQLASSTQAVDCAIQRGGVLAMRPLVVHSSSKSRSDARRRVLHIEYAPSLILQDGFELAVA
jgi:ectoine hydroxylase-related dioxygenase (phytanoyl-CoA dioxygenase family)